MASLNHVCMWEGHGWKRITAEEAAKRYPYGTIHADSGLFMCELCGQYVSLTNGSIRVRYFKHSRAEDEKTCPERTFGPGAYPTYSSTDHDLPIRICVSGNPPSSFSLEMGLVRVPENLLEKNFKLTIYPKGEIRSFSFTKERLNNDRIMYLPLWDHPYETYTLHFENGSNELYKFWPSMVKGINPRGTLFDKASGRMLSNDADVEIGKEYYLLQRSFLPHSSRTVKVTQLMQQRYVGESWILASVSASEFTEDAARFFLDFHYRLTDKPISLRPIWPLFVEGESNIKHNQTTMYMLVEGNTTAFQTSPFTKVDPLHVKAEQLKLFKVKCSDRQHLISVGRSQALQYTYFWREALNQEGTCPEISVTDFKDTVIQPGETDVLPNKKTLLFKSPYDGEIVINHAGRIDKRDIKADESAMIDGITYDTSIHVMIGLDVVWQIEFKRQVSDVSSNEMEILDELIHMPGPSIPVPHALSNILLGMSCYPQVCLWIRRCIKKGSIKEQSYRKLQHMYRSMHMNQPIRPY